MVEICLNNRFTCGISEPHQPEEPNLGPPATWSPLHWSLTAVRRGERATTSLIIISTQGGKCPLPPNQLGAILSWSFSACVFVFEFL